MQPYDVVTLGEALIDFVPLDGALPGRFSALPGGAPTNVACGLAKLGNRVVALARVGADPLGRCVVDAMRTLGVDTQYVQKDPRRHTPVAVVMPKSEDMLRFVIYKEDTADGALSFAEMPTGLWAEAKILHLGTLAMSSPTAKESSLLALRAAKQAGCVLSLDVNLRPGSWRSEEEMKTTALQLIETCDVVKLTWDEARVLGMEAERMAELSGKLFLLTDGPNGADIICGGVRHHQPALKVPVRDVTGCGDAFMCGFLHFYLRNTGMDTATLAREGARFATVASAVAIQKDGAIESLPTEEDIHRLMEQPGEEREGGF